MTGASATRGDIVRNLTTGRVGRVLYGLQSGRLLIELSAKRAFTGDEHVVSEKQTWERWNAEVIE